MIEDGQEWWGFGFGNEEGEIEGIEHQFMDNIRFLEHFCREHSIGNKKAALAEKIALLFERLPGGCEESITDDRSTLTKSIVGFRNRVAHGLYETPRPTRERILTLTTKLGALLLFNFYLDEYGAADVVGLSRKGSPYLRNRLSTSDKPS